MLSWVAFVVKINYALPHIAFMHKFINLFLNIYFYNFFLTCILFWKTSNYIYNIYRERERYDGGLT